MDDGLRVPSPHRSFVSVELPFLVSPPSPGTQAEVEAFLPPDLLGPCLLGAEAEDHSLASSSPSALVPREGKQSRTQQASGGHGPEGVHFLDSEGDGGDEEGGRRRSARPTPSQAQRVNGADADRKRRRRSHPDEGGETAEGERGGGGQSSGLGLAVANPHLYTPDPVFTLWRPTDWGTAADARPHDGGRAGSDTRVGDGDEEEEGGGPASFLVRQRREVFPSTVPQLLLEGYYRNDLLLQVTRRRRLRRVRAADTGAVVYEEEVPLRSAEDQDGEGPEESRVAVVGVVSRDVQLSRPADFGFSLFTQQEVDAAPQCCSGDLFPPMRFLGTRSVYQVPYTMGSEVNTSVQAHQRRVRRQEQGGADDGAGVDGERERAEDGDEAGEGDEERFTAILTALMVEPEDVNIPPPPTLAHKGYLAYLGCSPAVIAAATSGVDVPPAGPGAGEDALASVEEDGDKIACPVEVQVLSSILASRPVWLMEELKRAMTSSGVCPRAFTNKQVITCMTYCIRSGPFNRLRIRMGYNPYASSLRSAVYQRLAVRMHRRREVGVQVRDLARSPHIAEAVQTILQRHADDIVAARRRTEEAEWVKAAASGAEGGKGRRLGYFGTLRETLCAVVAAGTLNVACQFADLQDDDVYRDLIAQAPVHTDMPREQRRLREGWLTPQTYQRAISRFTEVLTTFLHDEVVPAVRALSASSSRRVKGRSAGAAAGSAPGGSDDDDEEGDVDGSGGSSVSALASSRSSTASSGSDAGDDEEEEEEEELDRDL